MTIDTDVTIDILDLDRAADLAAHRDAIAALFAGAFGKPLDPELWDWAYLRNPFGDAMVSVAMHQGRMIGHYAVIPLELRNDEGGLRAYLSMTTMVDAEFRMLGLFKTLAERVYARIEDRGAAAVVCGFPNDSSAPGFERKLGWTILDDVRVVTVAGEELRDLTSVLRRPSASYFLDLDTPQVGCWRTGKPGPAWSLSDGIGLKPHASGHDLMYVGDADALADVRVSGPVNVMLDRAQLGDRSYDEAFDYRFGYRAFHLAQPVDFFLQMCLSDVF